MKKLYIRFFENKNDNIPRDSHPLKIDNSPYSGETWFTTQFDDEISDWMYNHSDGKVDFVWF